MRALGSLTNYYLQSLVLVHWLMALAIQTLIALSFWRGVQIQWANLGLWRGVFQTSGWSLAILLALWLWVAWTGLGVIPDIGGWYPPGTPILISQVCFALAVSIAFLLLHGPLESGLTRLQKHGFKYARIDLVICAILWIATCLVWWAEPVQRTSYFSPVPVPPNYDHYPYAEAAEYDINAHNILLGYGQTMGLIRRPLYSFF